jgi:hypothetical protein
MQLRQLHADDRGGRRAGEHLRLDELGGSVGELFELEEMAAVNTATVVGSLWVAGRHRANALTKAVMLWWR